ncbi:MAG TPA: hypothetical protein VFI31_20730 [Pirellulales bacterium]|nr:hypothetical protein [Pirellulales bacterium]
MANVIEKPRHPTENWQATLDEWLSDIHSIVEQATKWAVARGWSTKVDTKTITEDVIGTYEAPRLLIHAPEARFLLDPIAKCVVGAEGRIDFCVIPSYDAVPLVKTVGGWRFLSAGSDEAELTWSDESFGKLCAELTAMQ